MKKIIIFILSTILLCGCSINKLPNDNCDFLINANWEGNDTKCVNVISFGENNEFSNWCYCGSPIGDSDLVENFRYSASDKMIYLLDENEEIIETGNIKYADNMYLVVDLWGSCYVYENIDMEKTIPRDCALEYVFKDNLTKPFLQVLDYKNGTLTVSAHDYDGDAAADFDIWTFDTDENISFLNVEVRVENGKESIEVLELTKDDYENIGDFYTGGYFEINEEGKVVSIVFYGETICEF